MYDELYNCYLYSSRKSYGPSPDFRSISSLSDQGFKSLYAITRETADRITAEGTTKLFKGVVWSPVLTIDFDSYEAAGRALSSLDALKVGYKLYDSGGRGGHVEIRRTHEPSHLLPYKDKSWVKKTFPEADHSIYTHLHPFRIEGTIHENTGRKKELVECIDGVELVLPKTLEEPNTYSGVVENTQIKSIFEQFRVMSHTRPVNSGDRHTSLVRLCYALKDDAQIPSEIAYWWLSEVNKMYKEPKREEDIEKIVRTIYQG